MEHNPYTVSDTVIDIAKPNYLTGDNLATRWQRLGAALIDSLLANTLTVACSYALYGQNAITIQAFNGVTTGFSLPQVMIETALGFFIFIVLHSASLNSTGQTLGKKVLGIAIVDYVTNTPLSLPKLYTLRYLPFWIINFILCLKAYTPFLENSATLMLSLAVILNVLFIFGKEKRCLHDYIAETKVVKFDKNSAFNASQTH